MKTSPATQPGFSSNAMRLSDEMTLGSEDGWMIFSIPSPISSFSDTSHISAQPALPPQTLSPLNTAAGKSIWWMNRKRATNMSW